MVGKGPVQNRSGRAGNAQQARSMGSNRRPSAPVTDPSPLPTRCGRGRTHSQKVLCRQRTCRFCQRPFAICRTCDRGHGYCGVKCRQIARRQQRRAANRRHQQSTEGRLDHRDRQREYRIRRRSQRAAGVSGEGQRNARPDIRRLHVRVTDHSSRPGPACVTVGRAPRSARGWLDKPGARRAGDVFFLRCVRCGRRSHLFEPYDRR